MLVDVREALDCDKSYLYTRSDNKTYNGCLLFENTDSCKSVTDLLKRNIGKRIRPSAIRKFREESERIGESSATATVSAAPYVPFFANVQPIF